MIRYATLRSVSFFFFPSIGNAFLLVIIFALKGTAKINQDKGPIEERKEEEGNVPARLGL
jgi:hypothetical protein